MKPGNIIVSSTCAACVEWTLVVPDYNRNFNEALKAAVPQDKREWNPTEKCWVIQGDWIYRASDIAVAHYPGAECEWRELE